MLIAMTYNVWLLLAILVGHVAGYAALTPYFERQLQQLQSEEVPSAEKENGSRSLESPADAMRLKTGGGDCCCVE